MTGLLWYLAETGAALGLFYGLYRLALKNDTHFQTTRLYLLASLVAAHLLPLVRVTSPFRQVVVPAGAAGDSRRDADDGRRMGVAADARVALRRGRRLRVPEACAGTWRA